jgi:hypothetical protein
MLIIVDTVNNLINPLKITEKLFKYDVSIVKTVS